MTSLQVEDLSLGYGSLTVVDRVSTAVPPGRVTAIVGANGCGKSTLLRGMARILTPTTGRVLLDGRPLTDLPTRQIARTLSLLPQGPSCPDGISVADLVGRGRTPHRQPWRGWTAEDEDAVAQALQLTGTADLAHRAVAELSGGQRQRVWLAMTLAQQTDLMLLDEPTTYLDLAHQIDLLELLRELNAGLGRTIVMVLHELNLAARYADHVIAMQDGRIATEGAPAQVFTAGVVEQVFGLRVQVMTDPVAGSPMLVPLGRPA